MPDLPSLPHPLMVPTSQDTTDALQKGVFCHDGPVMVRTKQSKLVTDHVAHPSPAGQLDDPTPGGAGGSPNGGGASQVQPIPQPGVANTGAGKAADGSVATLALSLLNAPSARVGLCTRGGARVRTANDMLRGIGGAMHERIAWACRQFDRDYPLPPADVQPPVQSLGRSEFLLADQDKFFEVVVSPIARVTLSALGEGMKSWGDCLVVIVRGRGLLLGSCSRRSTRSTWRGANWSGRCGSSCTYNAATSGSSCLRPRSSVRGSHDLLHFDHFAIRLLDEKTAACWSWGDRIQPAPDFDSFRDQAGCRRASGSAGIAAASGRSYLCLDTAKDELYLPGVEGARSSLTVPLRLHDKVIRIMNVESLQPGAFSEEDRQLGEIFGAVHRGGDQHARSPGD